MKNNDFILRSSGKRPASGGVNNTGSNLRGTPDLSNQNPRDIAGGVTRQREVAEPGIAVPGFCFNSNEANGAYTGAEIAGNEYTGSLKGEIV